MGILRKLPDGVGIPGQPPGSQAHPFWLSFAMRGESVAGGPGLRLPASAAMVLVRLDISLFLKPAILALKRAL